MPAFEERNGWLKSEGKASFELNGHISGIRFENLRAQQPQFAEQPSHLAGDIYRITLPEINAPLILTPQPFKQGDVLSYETAAFDLSLFLPPAASRALRALFSEPRLTKQTGLAMRLKVNLLSGTTIVDLNPHSELTVHIPFMHCKRQLLHFAGETGPWVMTASDWTDTDVITFAVTGFKLELELPKGVGQKMIQRLSQA